MMGGVKSAVAVVVFSWWRYVCMCSMRPSVAVGCT